MRPRCCLRYLTFFGINIAVTLAGSASRDPAYTVAVNQSVWGGFRRRRTRRPLRPALRSPWRPIPVFLVAADPRHQALALVEPDLDADLPVRRARFGEP